MGAKFGDSGQKRLMAGPSIVYRFDQLLSKKNENCYEYRVRGVSKEYIKLVKSDRKRAKWDFQIVEHWSTTWRAKLKF